MQDRGLEKAKTLEKGVTRLKVTIFEGVYSLKGDGDEQHITMLAAFVDKKMRQVKERNPHLSTAQIAVLTALNISDELAKLQEDYDGLVKIIQTGEKLQK